MGTGDATLQSGATLKSAGGLNVGGDFIWNGGVIEQKLGADTIHITGALDNSAGGVEFRLSSGAVNTAYTLFTFGDSTNLSLDALEANSLFGLDAQFHLINTGNTLQVIYLGAVSGPLLQNSGPVYTPTFADFSVDGAVATGTGAQNNTVKSLHFSDGGGSLTVSNRLTLGSGAILSGSESSVIYGGTLYASAGFSIENEGDLTISSVVTTGTGAAPGVIKSGDGLLTLLGNNSYKGGTEIRGGTLAVANNQNLGAASGAVKFAGGSLRALGSFATDRNALVESAGGALDVVDGVTLTWNGVVADGGTAGLLAKTGLGTVVLTMANTYSGGTTIDKGTVRTSNASALGSGAVTLNDGATLEVASQLNLSSFTWNGGGIVSLMPQSGGTINISGAFSKGIDGTFAFTLNSVGLDINQLHTLIEFGSLNGFTADDFSAPAFYGITPVFTLEDDNRLTVYYEGATSGPDLQNHGPVFTPLDANYFVSGAVATGGPSDNNQVDSLLFAAGSSLEVHNQLEVTSGHFTVMGGTASINGDEVYTPGDLTMSGPGSLVADVDLVVDGAANIEGGGLLVNGTLTSGDGVFIAHNALLGGGGVIHGNVTNHGFLSPGNSPGTLTIVGNYDQASNGAFLLEIASRQDFDRLKVSGVVSLGGTLDVIPYHGYQFEYGQKFTFIESGKTIGAFESINAPTGLRGRVIAEDGDVTLVIAPQSYTQVAQTQNQKNVAGALDRFIDARGGDREKVSIALDKLRGDQYGAAFNQIAPTFYESLANITIEQNNAQGQMLSQRFGAVRLGGVQSRGFSQVGMEAPIVAGQDGKSFSGKDIKSVKEVKDIMIAAPDNQWGVWIQGNGLFAKTASVNDIPRYNTDSGGFLLGADYRWSDTLTTGLYTGYQATKVRYDKGGNTAINSARFGAYATFDTGNGFYANGLIGGGWSDYLVRRSIDFGSIDRTARGNPTGGEFTALLGSGYDWKAGNFTFGPVASAQYTYVGLSAFEETGARSLNLRLADHDAQSLRSTVGARLAYAWQLGNGVAIIPEARMSWQHEFLQDSRTLTANLEGGGGPGFNYTTASPSRDAVYAGAGVNLQLGERWNANVYYNLNFGSGDFESQMISGGVNLRF